MTATPVSSPARLDYGLDTLSGRTSKSAECLIGLKVEPDQAPLLRMSWFSVGTLAALGSALIAMLVMFGTGFAAIVLAVAGNRMLTEFAGTFRAIADTFAVNHGV